MILNLERQFCGLCLFLTWSAGWCCLRMVVSWIKNRIRLGWGVGRLPKRRWCNFPHQFIDDHRGGRQLSRTIVCCRYKIWDRYTHDLFVRWCKRTLILLYLKYVINCCMGNLTFLTCDDKIRKQISVELIGK